MACSSSGPIARTGCWPAKDAAKTAMRPDADVSKNFRLVMGYLLTLIEISPFSLFRSCYFTIAHAACSKRWTIRPTRAPDQRASLSVQLDALRPVPQVHLSLRQSSEQA